INYINLINFLVTSLPCGHLSLKRRELIRFNSCYFFGASISAACAFIIKDTSVTLAAAFVFLCVCWCPLPTV
ncbi:hypothetical protein ACR79T_22020, partial [Sphingobacterium spiritivorum]|uniref:hypothetical protein n=1 Tax=Sphingobacterium spiritivorum TaxID=258 RepID=UPI003DA5C73B